MSANPRFYKADSIPEKELVLAKTGITFQAGQFMRSTDSGWCPVKSNGSQINGLAAETKARATAAGAKIYVHRLTSPAQQMVMCVTSGVAAKKANYAYVGGNWGVAVNSCIATISVGNDTTEILHVYGRLADQEPFFNDTSDATGKLIVGVVASALTAEGAGL